ncbi:MAG: hypothetical protein ABL951_07675 [Alphaproteobacteria bacterium]
MRTHSYTSNSLAVKGPARRTKIGAALLGLALLIPGFSQAAPCAVPVDQTSLQVRMLQTELMVAALTCNQRVDYNAFVTRFQPQLSAQGKQLQSFFKQKYGSSSAKSLNGFITRIANESSRRGMQKRGEFCRSAAGIYAASKKIDPKHLPNYAETLQFTSWHGISSCPTKVAVTSVTK